MITNPDGVSGERLVAHYLIYLLRFFPGFGTANIFTSFPQSFLRRIEADHHRDTTPRPWPNARLVSYALSFLLGQLFTNLKKQPPFRLSSRPLRRPLWGMISGGVETQHLCVLSNSLLPFLGAIFSSLAFCLTFSS